MLLVNNLSLKYPYGSNAFYNVSFEIDCKNRILCLFGESDAGKTSLIKAICHMISPSSGLVWVDDNLVNNINARKYFQIVPKDEGFLKNKTVNENLNYLLKIKSIDKPSRIVIIEKVLNELGAQYIKYEKISSLSPVEKTLFLMSKIYINESKILLIDDIFYNLSPQERGPLLFKLKNFILNNNKIAIYATSFYDDTISLDVDTIFLRYGIVEQFDNSKTIMEDPQKLYIDTLVNKRRNFIEKSLVAVEVLKYLNIQNCENNFIISYELAEKGEEELNFLKAKTIKFYYSDNFYFVETDLGKLVSLQLKDYYEVIIPKNSRYYKLNNELRFQSQN